ncbi:hypothetical protein EJD97_021683 [Solanum chilense]|uniref:Uncharacterized protein n=1 Tax=Solanum chilense TaxID=4083 RepID=A0A6N2AWY7_SOLCI|nr:hypothetical protein EJD97_021683 [Solanum chilense]
MASLRFAMSLSTCRVRTINNFISSLCSFVRVSGCTRRREMMPRQGARTSRRSRPSNVLFSFCFAQNWDFQQKRREQL